MTDESWKDIADGKAQDINLLPLGIPFIHFALTLADGIDAACDEMPEPACTDARITLTGFARALQITAERLKAEAGEKERTLMGVVG